MPTDRMFEVGAEHEEGTIEHWATQLGTPIWLFKACKVAHHWAEAKRMTEDEYSEAVDAIARSPISY